MNNTPEKRITTQQKKQRQRDNNNKPNTIRDCQTMLGKRKLDTATTTTTTAAGIHQQTNTANQFSTVPQAKRSSAKSPDGSQKITGKIVQLMIPQSIGEFTGWCRMKIMDQNTKISYIVQGMLPFIDLGFLYTFFCKDTRAKCYQDKKATKRYTSHATHDTIFEITKFIRVDKLPLTSELLVEFLVRFCHMTETAASRHVTNIPLDDMNLEALRNYAWFDMIAKETLFFLPDELIMVASFFGIESMVKMMKLSREKLEEILQMAKTIPYKLCAKSLHKLGHGIGEMSLDGLKYCTDTFKLAPIEPHVYASLLFYGRELKTMMESKGHAFITLTELMKSPLSGSAIGFIRMNNLLIRENDKFYTPESAMERNQICKCFEGIIERGSRSDVRFRVFKGGKLPNFDTDFQELKSSDGSILDSEQSKAVALSFKYPVVCIDGAPGTGKTSKVAEMMLRLHSPLGVLAVSATGNAADQFFKQTGKECYTVDRAIVMIRRVLRLILKNECAPPGTRKKRLPHKLHKSTTLIIEEGSLLDQTKYCKLLELLPDLCQVIFIGDLDQGKPIGRGFPFSDTKKAYPQCTIRLETNYRVDTASRSLLKLSKSVVDKNFEFSFVKENLSSDNPCIFMQRAPPTEGGVIANLQKIFAHFPKEIHDRIQVVTHKNTTRKKINQWYWDQFVRDPIVHGHIPANSSQKIFVVGQRIVITENVESVNVYKTGARSDSIKNGEVATIVSIVDEFYQVFLSSRKILKSTQNPVVVLDPNSTVDGIPISAIEDMSDDSELESDDDDDDDDDDDEDDDDHDNDEESERYLDAQSREPRDLNTDGAEQIQTDDSIISRKSKKQLKIREPQHSIEQNSTCVPPIAGYRRIINLSNGKRIDVTHIGLSVLEYATCMTITKSQGKEFPIIVFVFEPNDKTGEISTNLTSDWLMVGLSRAREKVIVVCDYQRSYDNHVLGKYSNEHRLGEFGKVMLMHNPTPINSDLHEYLKPLN